MPAGYYRHIRSRLIIAVTVVLVLAGLIYWHVARERDLVIFRVESTICGLLVALLCAFSYLFLKQLRELEQVDLKLEERQVDLELKAERLEQEQLLNQSQKMEAIWHLSGGIAHDFNNLLTPILIYSDMLKRSLPDNEKALSQLDGIIKASGKARDLTQQLLSFSRKQVMQMQGVDLNDVIMSFHSMVRRMLREDVSLSLQLSGQPIAVCADSSKLEQVLLDLVLNAQDAIAVNGSISIESGQVRIDDEFARRHPDIEPGRFVRLSCSDNGCGMSAETMTRIFEPFFSTKEVGHGTGLGLTNVYGIIKQHNGHVMAVSTVGVGTTFTIYLPVCDES